MQAGCVVENLDLMNHNHNIPDPLLTWPVLCDPSASIRGTFFKPCIFSLCMHGNMVLEMIVCSSFVCSTF